MLYKLNKEPEHFGYSKVKRVSLSSIGWKECDLERLISNNIQDFISSNDLMTIFTQRPRKEEPDILALDKNGDLYIFELKRWSSDQENLLQVLRYGQLFGNSDYHELNELYHKHYKEDKDELLEVHAKYFQKHDKAELKADEYNRKQHFIIVVNGLDQQTLESILYWKSNGLNMDAIVYWVFEIAGEHYIEFNMYSNIENFLEYESNHYVLNTNYSNNQQHTDEMIKNQKAAAYYPGWREKIKKFQKGDTVFLYQSGTGLIAYGQADGNLNKEPCDGNPDYEYNMKLDKFTRIEPPISAADMKKIAQKGFNFRQTLFSITDEDAKKFKDCTPK